ncbi:hypothetical protein HTZ84_20980 [Haloterrigena sp. SYSU A558-1]|uniref:Uncharacterized protein n=1 Tax=Haloterrigena gelatinilytica TaxID=2741724 RepID=A0ABX2LER2_9EURY|nr:hypothetical protein [Haloterrigena gelatinilytica]NUC74739.1 hypothetical protein [Haloterrigena gelatinilytica]
MADASTAGVTGQQIIDLVGGIILLAAAYFAVMSRRADQPEYRRAYSRAVFQYTAVFLVFAYAMFVLFPGSRAWPVRTGEHLWLFFQHMETVPGRANEQLTDYYRVLLRQIGYATGAGTVVMPGPLGTIEGMVRTVGLVVYTVVFTVVSLSVQIPARITAAVHDAVGSAENQ